MPRISALDPATAEGKAKDLLNAVSQKLGLVPNMMRTMAHAPSVLEGFLNFSAALAGGVLDAKTREAIAVTVASANRCGYCLSAHYALGKMAGLSPMDLKAAQSAKAEDRKRQAVLALADSIARRSGLIDDAEFAAARESGLSDAEIAETVANVALNALTNYFNHVARTEIDFPEVKAV